MGINNCMLLLFLHPWNNKWALFILETIWPLNSWGH
jgi:hypothetical protein